LITLWQGGIIHLTKENLRIDYLIIYQNDLLASNTVFKNGPIRSYSEFYYDIKKGDVIKAEAACNLHGI
jgi:desulfoferrodoxin (superoxide reductase-like protein)